MVVVPGVKVVWKFATAKVESLVMTRVGSTVPTLGRLDDRLMVMS